MIFAWGFHVAVDPARGKEAALAIGGDATAATLPEPNARVADAPCYEGRIMIPVALARGAREVTLRCALCDATRCLAPVTVRIPL